MIDKIYSFAATILWIMMIGTIVGAGVHYKASQICIEKIYGRSPIPMNKYFGTYCSYTLDLRPQRYWDKMTEREHIEKQRELYGQ